jgi:hypothetical protein
MFSLPLGQDQVKWHVWLEEEALWNRLRTLSHFAVLDGELLKVSVFSLLYPMPLDCLP